MNVKEFYKAVDGNYDEVFFQLGDDEFIVELLKKFVAKDEMDKLKLFLEQKNYNEAFICVHNMKGYGLNMALPLLHESASALCEEIRHGEPAGDIKPLIDSLDNAYSKIKNAVMKL